MPAVATRVRWEQQVACTAGALLLASGFFHIGVWIVDGGSLSGPVSWRKPILFGFSAGVTMLSLAWLLGKVPRHRGDSIIFCAFSAAMLTEVGLITLQQWRGVASHFNRSTPLDSTILTLIEWLIIFATLVIAEMTRRCFGKLAAPRDMAIAIRGGMILLLFGCLLGFVLVAHGNLQQAAGRDPAIYGKAGIMKFPHGMPLHAIQLLPMAAWLLRKLGAPELTRKKSVATALAAVIAFTIYSLLQTFTGRPRFDAWWLSSILLMVASVLCLISVKFAIAGIRTSHESSNL